MPQAPNDNPESAERPELADELPRVLLSRVRNRVQQKLDSVNAVVADLVNTLEAINAAEGRLTPERAPETWTLDHLREWLSTTRSRDGATLESKLEGGSLDAQVERYVRAFAEGDRGFSLDPTTLRFQSETATLHRLQNGLECGAITGLVIEAYPNAADLEAMAHRLSADDPATELNRLLRESVLEFLIRHFQARGGKVNEAENRPAHWRTMRWSSTGKPIWKAFHERAAEKGRAIVVHYMNSVTKWPECSDDYAGIYATLDDQPTVQDVLGTASLVFTNTERDVPKRGKVLGAVGITKLRQGPYLSSTALIQHRVDTLSPTEYLALVAAISTPANPSTYPDQDTLVWLTGMDRRDAVFAGTNSDRLDLDWTHPYDSRFGQRVRSVVRCIS